MSASGYVGRVGSLAVLLGVGAAVFSGAAVATADTGADAADSATTPNSATAPKSAVRAGRVARAAAAAGLTSDSAPGPAAPRSAAATESAPATGGRSARKSRPAVAARDALRASRSSAARSAARESLTDAASAGAAVSAVAIPAPAEPSLPPIPAAAPPAAAAIRPMLSAADAAPRAFLAKPAAASAVAGAVNAADFADLAPQVGVLVATALAQVAAVTAIAAASIALPSPLKASPTLVLDGYNLVPKNTETVTGYYGRWTYLPGAPSLVQGTQQFDVVDPDTGEPVGSFDALVSRGNGYNYQELLVTATDATDVGTGAGQVPPVGSFIAGLNLGGFGWSYSAMPAPSGDVVAFKILTPFREFPLPLDFNAAEGVADHTVDNRPMDLTNGYSIAPADPTAENLIGTSGILPLYTTVQGNQKFNVLDADGNAVGTFDGVFTTTWDIIAGGIGTQAVLVTATEGTNVGTAAGQVPPVGTVYNIMYIGDTVYLYSSMPSPSGDVISLVVSTPDGVVHAPVTFINASREPAAGPLTAPGGYRFEPVAELQPTGVNGLPPREVQIQGYQQFDVYDSAGTKVGRVDADVANQWDLLGIHSRALLVTNVSEGTAGTGAGDVPPVGSTFNWVSPARGGFGIAHSTVPAATEDVTSYSLLTPLGDFAFPALRIPAEGRTDVRFYSPFQSV